MNEVLVDDGCIGQWGAVNTLGKHQTLQMYCKMREYKKQAETIWAKNVQQHLIVPTWISAAESFNLNLTLKETFKTLDKMGTKGKV